MILLLVLLIFLYSAIKPNKSILYSEEIYTQNDFCTDSDGDLSLLEQSKNYGWVLILHKSQECDWSEINRLNSSNNLCAFSLTYNDYCIDNINLKERACEDNKSSTKIVACVTSCQNGKCL